MEDAFRRVVEHIFNNWTALKLAVQHSMGGPDSKKIALDCVDYMTQFCIYESNVDVDDIEAALEDIMDQEFDTMCEDGSTREVANVLYRFLQLVKAGNITQYEDDFKSLPVVNSEWLTKSQALPEVSPASENVQVTNAEQSSTSNNEATMEEDSDWTHVKSRRKR